MNKWNTYKERQGSSFPDYRTRAGKALDRKAYSWLGLFAIYEKSCYRSDLALGLIWDQ